MANIQPKQSPDYRAELCALINRHLALREWSPAKLARESGQSKATISRITNYRHQGKLYQPSMRAIQGIALALNLTDEERRELFYTAFPEFFVWDEASKKGYDVIQTDQMLEEKGLPLLTVIKNKY